MGTTQETDRAREVFRAQAAARWRVAQTTADERIARLRRLRDVIRARRDELCTAVRADYGKHPVETELTELVPVLEELKVAIRDLREWMRPRRVGTPLTLFGSRSELHHEPRGVVLVLAPWNYPFQLVMTPLVAAVAAGNCVTVRPSHRTPRTALFLHDLVASVFPEEEAAVVLGDRAVAEALLDLPFDHVFFTGSVAGGRTVMSAAARHLSSVTLELGGKSPVIVDETADVGAAAERIAWGKFVNAGQTCVAPDYALVQDTVADRFAAAMARVVERFYGADDAARMASTDMACLVDQDACRRLEGAIRADVAAGARLITGGQVDVPARRVAPTVITGVSAGGALMAGEIFGPVLPILSFRTLDEAVALVRSRPAPLALYVFTRTRRTADALLRATAAGGTCVNHVVVHLANPHLPFGGVGESGMGRYHGRFGFEEMSHARAVLIQGPLAPMRLLFPPYAGRPARLVSWLRRLTG